jgi:plasmid stability protein
MLKQFQRISTCEGNMDTATHSVTVNLPTSIYERVRRQAMDKNRSVEDELTAVVETAVSLGDEWAGIPPDLAEEAAQLALLNDEHLWRVARMSISAEKSDRMQALTWKLQSEGLTEAEQQETQLLQRLAHRVMLLRAEAAILLRERGFDLSSLRQPPATE